ncbi:hypothetical protein AB0J82_21830 [Asanoa sp. NPDC049518]|uniref:hypothetical protein n=1 Tax=unclassified Asanoa TaxID=2685164 RepID=UPI0034371A92
MTDQRTGAGRDPDHERRIRGGGHDGGRITVADGVVKKIAAVAARDVPGVVAMGTGAATRLQVYRQQCPLIQRALQGRRPKGNG